MLKEITPVNRVITNASMSGVALVTSLASNISYKDSVAYQVQWSGIPSGAFDVQGSVDYNPGLPQSNGSPNAGRWTSITLSPTISAAGSGSSQALINLNQLAFPWIRIAYTNSSGQGVLNGYLFAKSLG